MSSGPEELGGQSLFGLVEYKGDGQYVSVEVGGLARALQPVVLYVHGWQPGAYKKPVPDSFVTPKDVYGESRDVAVPWH